MNLLISRVPVLLPGGRRLGEVWGGVVPVWSSGTGQLLRGDDEGGALVPWVLFPVPWELLWSLVSLSHLHCSLLSISSLNVSLLSGAELSSPHLHASCSPIFVSPPLLVRVNPVLVPLSWQAGLGCSVLLKPLPWGDTGATGERQGWDWTGMGSIPLPFLSGPSDRGSLERCRVPRAPRAAPLRPKLGEPGSSVNP